jgi:CelD/BcsL family acetyltransferase involved in cellulose biosynthesis
MHLSQKLSYLGVVLPSLSMLPSSWKDRHQPRRFATVDGLFAHWHDTLPEDSTLRMSWEHLVRTRTCGTTFHTPAWQEALARAYIRAGRYRLLTISDGPEVLGVLPLQIEAGGTLETLGSMISDYLEPLVSEKRAEAVWASCLHALNRVPGVEATQVILHNCRCEHVDLYALGSAAAAEGFSVSTEECALTARVPLAPTWEEYLARLSGHDRKEIRRKLRNAQTKADAQLVVAGSEDEVRAALDNVFAYMRQAGGSKGMKAQWTYRPMFKRATAGLTATGRIKVYILKLEGRDAAGLICFPSKDGPLLWAAGYDNAMCKWSPGIVLFAMAMQRAIAEGAQYFDLLRGQQRYKHELGAIESPIYRITLTKN